MKKIGLYFLLIWALNALITYVFAYFYPTYYVLGNKFFGPFIAVVLASLIWTGIVWVAKPILKSYVKKLSRSYMFLFYFIANFVALWLVTRLAPYVGFGVVRFTWLVILAITADLMQYGVWKVLAPKR